MDATSFFNENSSQKVRSKRLHQYQNQEQQQQRRHQNLEENKHFHAKEQFGQSKITFAAVPTAVLKVTTQHYHNSNRANNDQSLQRRSSQMTSHHHQSTSETGSTAEEDFETLDINSSYYNNNKIYSANDIDALEFFHQASNTRIDSKGDKMMGCYNVNSGTNEDFTKYKNYDKEDINSESNVKKSQNEKEATSEVEDGIYYEGAALQSALSAFGTVASAVGGMGHGLMGNISPGKLAGNIADWRERLAEVVAPLESHRQDGQNGAERCNEETHHMVVTAADVFGQGPLFRNAQQAMSCSPVFGGDFKEEQNQQQSLITNSQFTKQNLLQSKVQLEKSTERVSQPQLSITAHYSNSSLSDTRRDTKADITNQSKTAHPNEVPIALSTIIEQSQPPRLQLSHQLSSLERALPDSHFQYSDTLIGVTDVNALSIREEESENVGKSTFEIGAGKNERMKLESPTVRDSVAKCKRSTSSERILFSGQSFPTALDVFDSCSSGLKGDRLPSSIMRSTSDKSMTHLFDASKSPAHNPFSTPASQTSSSAINGAQSPTHYFLHRNVASQVLASGTVITSTPITSQVFSQNEFSLSNHSENRSLKLSLKKCGLPLPPPMPRKKHTVAITSSTAPGNVSSSIGGDSRSSRGMSASMSLFKKPPPMEVNAHSPRFSIPVSHSHSPRISPIGENVNMSPLPSPIEVMVPSDVAVTSLNKKPSTNIRRGEEHGEESEDSVAHMLDTSSKAHAASAGLPLFPCSNEYIVETTPSMEIISNHVMQSHPGFNSMTLSGANDNALHVMAGSNQAAESASSGVVISTISSEIPESTGFSKNSVFNIATRHIINHKQLPDVESSRVTECDVMSDYQSYLLEEDVPPIQDVVQSIRVKSQSIEPTSFLAETPELGVIGESSFMAKTLSVNNYQVSTATEENINDCKTIISINEGANDYLVEESRTNISNLQKSLSPDVMNETFHNYNHNNQDSVWDKPTVTPKSAAINEKVLTEKMPASMLSGTTNVITSDPTEIFQLFEEQTDENISHKKTLYDIQLNQTSMPVSARWVEAFDVNSGKPYFYDKETGESSWEIPFTSINNVEDASLVRPMLNDHESSDMKEGDTQYEVASFSIEESSPKMTISEKPVCSKRMSEENVLSFVHASPCEVACEILIGKGSSPPFDGPKTILDKKYSSKINSISVLEKVDQCSIKKSSDEGISSEFPIDLHQIKEKNSSDLDAAYSIKQSGTFDDAVSPRLKTLPEGWIQAIDPAGRPFYFNQKTGQSSWEREVIETSYGAKEFCPTTKKKNNVDLDPTWTDKKTLKCWPDEELEVLVVQKDSFTEEEAIFLPNYLSPGLKETKELISKKSNSCYEETGKSSGIRPAKSYVVASDAPLDITDNTSGNETAQQVIKTCCDVVEQDDIQQNTADSFFDDDERALSQSLSGAISNPTIFESEVISLQGCLMKDNKLENVATNNERESLFAVRLDNTDLLFHETDHSIDNGLCVKISDERTAHLNVSKLEVADPVTLLSQVDEVDKAKISKFTSYLKDEQNHLPLGWFEAVDQSSGHLFYYNEQTGKTSWEKPNQEKELINYGDLTGDAECTEVGIATQADISLMRSDKRDRINMFSLTNFNESNVELSTPDLPLCNAHEVDNSKNSDRPSGLKNQPTSLPLGLFEPVDPSSGNLYYYSAQTEEISWEKPSEIKEATTNSGTCSGDNVSLGGEVVTLNDMVRVKLDETKRSVILGKDTMINSTNAPSSGWTELMDKRPEEEFHCNDKTEESRMERPTEDNSFAKDSCTEMQDSKNDSELLAAVAVAKADDITLKIDDRINDDKMESVLAAGWQEYIDDASGKYYYFNEATGATSWEKPISLFSDVSDILNNDKDFTFKQSIEIKRDNHAVHSETAKKCDDSGMIVINDELDVQLSTQKYHHLPDGWVTSVDELSGRTYYFNETTNESIWEKPVVLNAKSEAGAIEKRDFEESALHNRPAHAVASFGFGGRLCVMIPKVAKSLSGVGKLLLSRKHLPMRRGPVVIHRLRDLISRDHKFYISSRMSSPMVNIRDDDVLSFLDEKSTSSQNLLWKVVNIAARNGGRLRDDKIDSSQGPATAIVDLLLSSNSTHLEPKDGHKSSLSQHLMQRNSFSNDMNTEIEEIQNHLLRGNREEAVVEALGNKNYALALLISTMCGAETFQIVARQFADEVLFAGSPLHTIALMLSHNLEPPPTESIVDPYSTSFWCSEIYQDLCSTWKYQLASILSNRRHDGWAKIVLTLGDRLMQLGHFDGAHICYLMCGCPIGTTVNVPTRVLLLGCDHNIPLNAELMTPESIEAFKCTEAFEWARRKGNRRTCLPSLQPFKLRYAELLADFGHEDLALEYVISIRKVTGIGFEQKEDSQVAPPSSGPSPVVIYSKEFLHRLNILEDRVSVSMNSRISSMIKNSKDYKTSLGRLSGVFARKVSHEKEKKNDKHQLPSTGKVENNSLEDDFLGILESKVVTSEGAYFDIRSSAPKKMLKSSKSPKQDVFISANPSLSEDSEGNIPKLETIGQATFAPQRCTNVANENEGMGLLTHSPSTGDFSSTSPTLSSDEIMPKKPDELKTKAQSPASTPSIISKDVSQKAPISEPPKSGGWFSKLLGRDKESRAKVADVGEEMQAYYDGTLKRWIFPGDDPAEIAKPLAPPPIATPKADSIGAFSTPAESNDPLVALMAPPSGRLLSSRKSGYLTSSRARYAESLASIGNVASTPAVSDIPPGQVYKCPDSPMRQPPKFAVFQPKPTKAVELTDE